MPSSSPVRSIWLRPAETIAAIAHDNPGYRLYLLPIVAGFAVWPTMALFATDDDQMAMGFFLSSLLAFGPVVEVLQVFVGAWLIRMTGTWLGGRAGTASIQAAIAWCNLPIVVLALLGLGLTMLSGFLLESAGIPLWWNQSAATATVGWLLFLLQSALVVWSLVIFVTGLAAVQGYSVWRAALNTGIAWGIVAVVFSLAVFAVTDIEGLRGIFFAGIDNLVFIDEP